MTGRWFRRTAGAVAVSALFGLSLTGCVADPNAPTVIATPQIEWVDGVKPSSPLEKDKYVKFLRGLGIGNSMAINFGDYTIKQLTDYVEPAGIREISKYSGWGYQVELGPSPFEPLSVTLDPDGKGATVTVCEFKDANLVSPPLKDVKDMVGRRALVDVAYIRMAPNGHLSYAGGAGTRTEECDGSKIPIGYFVPVPKVEDPVTRDVRGPLPTLAPGQPDDPPSSSPSPSSK